MFTVVLIIAIAEAFIIIGMWASSKIEHYDGRVIVLETEDKKTFTLDYKGDPNLLDQKKQVVFRVDTSSG